MRKIKVAQIGVGHDHAIEVWQTVTALPEIYEVVGWALPEGEHYEAREEKLAGYLQLTVEQIMQDPTIDAVLIETEEKNLTDYAMMAARAGKHIHMDKPGGMSLSAFEALVQTARQNARILHLGYMYRYNPAVMALFDKIKQGQLGKVICVEAQMNCWHKPEKRQWMERLPGGMMFYLGCHLIDLILRLQGEPLRVIPMNRCIGLDGVTATDFGMALLEYPTGISLVKATDTEQGGYARRQLVVSCEKATAQILPLERRNGENQIYAVTTLYESNRVTAGGESTTSELFDRYSGMMTAFAAMVRGEKENPYTYDYELMLYKTVLKACGQ